LVFFLTIYSTSTVLEFCDGTDLNQHLKKYKVLAEKEAKLIIRQVLAALHYMSVSPTKVIHYDLKP
jgi:tousled-like kinase